MKREVLAEEEESGEGAVLRQAKMEGLTDGAELWSLLQAKN